MRATFAIAALAGSAIAAPGYGYQEKEHNQVQNVHVVVETVVQTIYVTEGYEVPKATSTPAPVYQAPAVTTVVYEEPAAPSSKYEEPAASSSKYEEPAASSSKYEAPAYTPAPVPTPEPEKPTPTPTPTPTPAPQPPASSGYMGTVDTWRAKLGLKALKQSSKLEANALNCAQAGNGEMVHKLNPGTYAQVLAPGDINAGFEHVFVGGWLCEISTLAGLDGVCTEQSKGWTYQGQTGHAEILTSGSYSEIGCAEAGGIVACDLA